MKIAVGILIVLGLMSLIGMVFGILRMIIRAFLPVVIIGTVGWLVYTRLSARKV